MPLVLVVDDSPVDRRIAGECARRAGDEVLFAASAEEALDVLQDDEPDVVVTDLVMPGMSGLDLISEIRSRNAAIPIIVITGKGSEEVAIEALRRGATSYVSKACLLRDLEETLYRVRTRIEAKQLRDQARQLLRSSSFQFELGYEPDATQALVTFVQSLLESVSFGNQTLIMQIGIAISEAITNALEHGNLELDSSLRDQPGNPYRNLADQRMQELPYRERRVQVTISLDPQRLEVRVRDEGPGFDPQKLPDPTDPDCLLQPSGRGIMLARTFMDVVRFNEKGNEVTLIKFRPQE